MWIDCGSFRFKVIERRRGDYVTLIAEPDGSQRCCQPASRREHILYERCCELARQQKS